MSDLYTMEILRLAASIPLTERLADPDASVTRTSRICGSRISVDVNFDGEAIGEYGQTVKACALGQASSSLFARKILGETPENFLPAARAFRAMLKGEGPPPTGKWADFAIFEAAKPHRSRHASILLPFDAVESIFRERAEGATADQPEAAESL